MNFHRLTDPAYTLFSGESFPSTPGAAGSIGGNTYDRLNVTSGGTGTGPGGEIPAGADASKGSGINRYTYFVAFAEDGLSAAVNRGFKALGQNTDKLDDLFRTLIPRTTVQTAAATGTNAIAVTGYVFCGDTGGIAASDLVSLAQDGVVARPPYNGTTLVVPVDIDDGTPGSSVIGTGWVLNPTVRLNTSLTVAYQLSYGGRTTLARTIEREREATWTAGLRSLATRASGFYRHGLNELYRRASALTTAGTVSDQAGSGATFVRDGKGMTGVAPSADWSAARAPDPFGAVWRAEFDDYLASTYLAQSGGDTAFLALDSARYTIADPNERTASSSLLAHSAAYIPRDIRAATLNGVAVKTYIPKAATAVLNPGGAGGALVRLNSPYFFQAAGVTAIRLERDILVVTYPDQSQQAYKFNVLSGTTDAYLEVLSGHNLNVPFTANTNVTVQWFSSSMQLGGSWGPMLSLLMPEVLSVGGAPPDQRPGPMELVGEQDASTELLRVGVVQPDGLITTKTRHYSNGDIVGGAGTLSHAIRHRAGSPHTITTNTTVLLDAYVGASQERFECPLATGVALTIELDPEYAPVEGDEIVLTFNKTSGNILTVTWPSMFLFSGPDGDLRQPFAFTTKFVGHAVTVDGIMRFLMTRTDY